jgi:hypothetical protein
MAYPRINTYKHLDGADRRWLPQRSLINLIFLVCSCQSSMSLPKRPMTDTDA